VDNAVLTPAGRHKALKGIRSFVGERLSSGGFRTLVVSELGGTRVLTSVDSSLADVRAALDEIGASSAGGSLAHAEERQVLDTMRDFVEMYGGCMDALEACIGVARAHAEERSFQLSRTLDRLSALVGALEALPGRKALVYVNEGLEQRPGIHLFHQIGEICPAALRKDWARVYGPMEEYDASRALQELAARANAARVTLYPLDARGLWGASIVDVSVADRRYVGSASNDAIREANLRAPQEILAQETGGFAIVASNDASRILARIPEELTTRYDLGFAPARAPDGRSHAIEVRLRRGKGLRVRHRASYVHAAPEARQADRTMAALLFGVEEDRLGAAISAGLATREDPSAAGRVAAVRVSVPIAGLAGEPDPQGRHARLRIVIAVRGLHAAVAAADVREKEVLVLLPEAAAAAAHHEIVVDVPLCDGPHDIAVGVHDALSSLASYRRLRVN
jgi:VWFA-related protein